MIRWTKQLSLYGLEVDPLLLARVRADRVVTENFLPARRAGAKKDDVLVYKGYA